MDLADKHEYIKDSLERINDLSSNVHWYCIFLLRNTVYWFQSSRNLCVNSPKFAEHMNIGDYGYQLKMGANIFLVEKFFLNVLYKIQEIIEAIQLGIEYTLDTIKYLIEQELTNSVMHENGMIYREYPIKFGYLMFGVHGISVYESFTTICGITGLHKLWV